MSQVMRTAGKTKRARRAKPLSGGGGGWLGRRLRMLFLAAVALW
jgi:hypothetical protein